MEDGVTYTINKIGNSLFEAYDAGDVSSMFTSITLPNTITRIEDRAFNHCECLTKVLLPEGIEEIGLAAFSNCSKLTEVRLPDSLKIIEAHAFSGCKGLSSIFIPLEVNFPLTDRGSLPFGYSNQDLKIYCAKEKSDPSWDQYWDYYSNYTGNIKRLDVTYGVTREQYEEIIKQNP